MVKHALYTILFVLSLTGASVWAQSDLTSICQKIESSVSTASSVAYPGLLSAQYHEDVSHWASSSSQLARCTVRPGSTEDLSTIIRILGSTRTPFAVKGGGHATNPGFSSTKGVLISMHKFSEVTYDQASQTAVIGAGLVWDDVYAALTPHNVTAVGARLPGIGVGGFSLGGGYSYLTNQHGLTIDNIVGYELVKPDGTVVQVTDSSDPDLFFGLKGGFNNFGIVTRFTMKTHPQGQVWGGTVWYPLLTLSEVSKAIEEFSSKVEDPKAAIFTTYHPIDDYIPFGSYAYNLVDLPSSSGVIVTMFYDAPQPPAGLFDNFLKIPYLSGGVEARDYLSLIQSYPTNLVYGLRVSFETVPIAHNSHRILEAVRNETEFWGTRLTGRAEGTYFVEPFLSSILSHNTSPTAWPPSRSTAYTPLLIAYGWLDPALDGEIYEVVRLSAEQIRRAAVEDGQDPANAPIYPNYAQFDTPSERIYGDNLTKLKDLKAKVDPDNVMGLAGGWKL